MIDYSTAFIYTRRRFKSNWNLGHKFIIWLIWLPQHVFLPAKGMLYPLRHHCLNKFRSKWSLARWASCFVRSGRLFTQASWMELVITGLEDKTRGAMIHDVVHIITSGAFLNNFKSLVKITLPNHTQNHHIYPVPGENLFQMYYQVLLYCRLRDHLHHWDL